MPFHGHIWFDWWINFAFWYRGWNMLPGFCLSTILISFLIQWCPSVLKRRSDSFSLSLSLSLSASSVESESLTVLGFGAWVPQIGVSVDEGSSVLSAIGFQATYCIWWQPKANLDNNKVDYPMWLFNFKPLPSRVGMPSVWKFLFVPKSMPNLVGAVSAIKWPPGLAASFYVGGAYRCSGPENLKAETHYLFVTGGWHEKKEKTRDKSNPLSTCFNPFPLRVALALQCYNVIYFHPYTISHFFPSEKSFILNQLLLAGW